MIEGGEIMAETHTRGVTLIVYRGEIVASAGARRSYLAPQIATLDAGEPLRQFVSLMAAFALLVRDGSNEGPYTDEAAERFARLALIDDEQFRVLDASGLEDEVIAGHFDVPVEQVAEKRVDLDR
jgi:hypothetical protein